VNTYHSVTYILSVTSKLLEQIVCRHLLQHLDRHKILAHPNNGFRKGFSCETQLAVTVDDLIRYNDIDLQTDIAVLDFSKTLLSFSPPPEASLRAEPLWDKRPPPWLGQSIPL